jgi:hypothetical protein
MARLAGTLLSGYLGEIAKQSARAAAPEVEKFVARGATRALANSPLLQSIGAGTAQEVSGILGSTPIIGGALSSLPVAPFQTVAQNLPAAGGRAAGILANVGTQAALTAPIAIAQDMLKPQATSKEQDVKHGIPLVLPRQQAMYNAMFVQQMQNPYGYYQGM